MDKHGSRQLLNPHPERDDYAGMLHYLPQKGLHLLLQREAEIQPYLDEYGNEKFRVRGNVAIPAEFTEQVLIYYHRTGKGGRKNERAGWYARDMASSRVVVGPCSTSRKAYMEAKRKWLTGQIAVWPEHAGALAYWLNKTLPRRKNMPQD
jgi:hypothetical protein